MMRSFCNDPRFQFGEVKNCRLYLLDVHTYTQYTKCTHMRVYTQTGSSLDLPPGGSGGEFQRSSADGIECETFLVK